MRRPGEVMPARVQFRAADGRYLPPLGHRDEVNPGLNEDTGADLVLGDATYAYVPGRFSIELPDGTSQVEAIRGSGTARAPVDRGRVTYGASVLALDRVAGPSGADWVAADCHVHFISPTSALLQARAEDVDVVNLLATQWGDHHTSVADLPAVVVQDPPAGTGGHGQREPAEHARSHRPAWHIPGGPAHGERGVARGPSRRSARPACSRIGPTLSTPSRAGWPSPSTSRCPTRRSPPTSSRDGSTRSRCRLSRQASTAHRSASGTDSSTAATACRSSVARTRCRPRSRSARSGRTPGWSPVRPISFETWAEAVRAGRTFVSSGPFVGAGGRWLRAGRRRQLGRGGGPSRSGRSRVGRATGHRRPRAHPRRRVIASTDATPGTIDLELTAERVTVSRAAGSPPGSRAGADPLGLRHGMGAHTSPVYSRCPDKPAFDAGRCDRDRDDHRRREDLGRADRDGPLTGGTSATGCVHGGESAEARPPRPGALAPLRRYSIVRTFSKGWPSASGPIVE